MMRIHKKGAALAAVIAVGLGTSGYAQALEAGDWFGRVGASYVDVNDKARDRTGAGVGDGVGVSNARQLSFTIGRMISPNLAVELLGALPIEHDITLDGTKVGTTKHLPPVLSLQYHFAPQAGFRPYVGIGANYSFLYNTKTSGALAGSKISLKDSTGLAGQIGADFAINRDWFVNVDIRYIDIDTKAKLDGADLAKIQIDPYVYTLAIGRKF